MKQELFKRIAAKRPKRSTRVRVASVLFGGLAALAVTQPALSAAPPTFSIITPSEFNLPIPEPGNGINFFFQNVVFLDDSERYNKDGEKVDNPGGESTLLTVTRFGRLFSFESIPNVGFYWEVLLPYVNVNTDLPADSNPKTDKEVSISGLVDPLVALTVYTRPTPNFLIGFENFVSAPIGDISLCNCYTYRPNIIFDYTIGRFGIDGLAGFTFRTENQRTGADPGTSYYVDLRFRYQVTDWFIPAISYDYRKTTGRTDGSGESKPDSYEHIVGAGVQVIFNESGTMFGSLGYRVGVDGKNTVRTQGTYARFVYLW